ncbi:hypothetical protein BN1708_019654, partial [Verticillium longisporum]
ASCARLCQLPPLHGAIGHCCRQDGLGCDCCVHHQLLRHHPLGRRSLLRYRADLHEAGRVPRRSPQRHIRKRCRAHRQHCRPQGRPDRGCPVLHARLHPVEPAACHGHVLLLRWHRQHARP